jgi:hypothetical protein
VSVSFAHIVVVLSVLSAVAMLDAIPLTSSHTRITRDVAASEVLIAIIIPVSFSFCRNFTCRSWQCCVIHKRTSFTTRIHGCSVPAIACADLN